MRSLAAVCVILLVMLLTIDIAVFLAEGEFEPLRAATFLGRLIAIGLLFKFLPSSLQQTARLKQYEDLFDTSQDMMCIAKGPYLTQVNKAWEKTLGYTKEEILGTPYLDFIHPDDKNKTVEAATQIEEKKELMNFRNRYRDKKGIYHQLSWSAVVNPSGAHFATARDETARLEIEEELRLSEQRFRAITECSNDAVILVDSKGIITFWNKAAVNIFGYKENEIVGQPLVVIIPNKYKEAHAAAFKKYLASGKGNVIGTTVELEGLKKDGKEFALELSLAALEITNQGKLFSGAIRDISKRKELEDALKHTNRELEQFAYIASHDLKAPLRGISNLATWIEEDLGTNLPAESKKNLGLLKDRVHRMDLLIDGILQYSRVGRVYIEEEPVDLNVIISETLENIDKKNFTFKIDEMPTITGNKTVIGQLFSNLIGNAVKHHTRDDGNIEVTATDNGNHYEFSVKDDGPGIASNMHHKLFAMFQPLTQTKGSTGIGLALCKKIVESKGGKIWLESEKDQGAKFTFTWTK